MLSRPSVGEGSERTLSTSEITTEDIQPVDGDQLDAWLADPGTVPGEATVYICIDGKRRRKYEDVKARIAERAQAAEDAATAAADTKVTAFISAVADDRLATKTPKPAEAVPARDHEQDLLEQLIREMKTKTVPFVIRSVGSPRWNELQAAHPPRKEADTGRLNHRDAPAGFNVATFYVALVRESIASPPMTDARYASLLQKLTDAQFTRLAQAAADVNSVEADDLPF